MWKNIKFHLAVYLRTRAINLAAVRKCEAAGQPERDAV